MKINRNEVKNNLEIILTIAIATIIMLFGIYYLPWITFLYPIPFIVLGVKYGISYNIFSLIVSTLSLGLIVDKTSGIFILLAFVPLSVALNYTLKKGKKHFEIITISTLVALASFLLLINIMTDMTGVSIIIQMEEFFTNTLNIQIEALKDMELSSYEVLKIKDGLENAFDYVLLIIPSIVMMFSLVTAYLNYLISTLILRKLGYGIVSIPKFSKFKLPNNILIGTGIMFLGAFIIKSLELFYYETILLNITALASFMFFIQGLSVVDHSLIENKVKKIPRILMILFFIIVLPLAGIISFIGVIDSIVDFRKLRKNV